MLAIKISTFLLANGAGINIFFAAMLGKTNVVKSVLTSYPTLKSPKGSHVLQLVHHAKKGGEDAKEVLDYLQSFIAS